MSVVTQVLFGKPQHEIAGLIRSRLQLCKSTRIVVGFATVEGLDALFLNRGFDIARLEDFVVGAGTYRAFDAMDRLLAAGAAANHLWVHLGHSRLTGGKARHPFYRYHPMLHSKVYYMEMDDGTASVVIGSHNLTGFAMNGLNGEAAVLMEGPVASPEMQAVRDHIDACVAQSAQYSSDLKEAFSWWTLQFLDGLRDRANDGPREGEGKATIVILAVRAEDSLPQKDDVIYFEIPLDIRQIESLRAEVHIYVFGKRPASPQEGLLGLQSARKSLWCQTLGLEREQGGVELRADWHIIGRDDPRLVQTRRPFRPAPGPGMQQVRVKVRNEVFGRFQYLFQSPKTGWRPVFSPENVIQVHEEEVSRLQSLDLIPPEDKQWQLVCGLAPVEAPEPEGYAKALLDSSPEAGGYILISRRRVKLD